jgi:hypothetical protein
VVSTPWRRGRRVHVGPKVCTGLELARRGSLADYGQSFEGDGQQKLIGLFSTANISINIRPGSF